MCGDRVTTTMGTMDTKQFERMWATRPVRPRGNRTVAGVCAGIGARYRVDPTLVKVAFVVATLFGGSGLLLYIAAWITLPGQDRADQLGTGATERWDGQRGPRASMTNRNGKFILLIVLAIILLTSFGPNATWSSGGLVGAALMLLGWWLLYQRTPEPPPGTSADTYRPAPVTAGWSGTPEDLQRWVPRSMTDTATGATTPVPQQFSAENPYPPSPYPAAPYPAAQYPTAPYPTGSFPTPSSPTAPYPPTSSHPAAQQPPVAGPGAPVPPADSGPAASGAAASGSITSDDPHRIPPAWDPLGAAEFAWDLPEPAPRPTPGEVKERRSPLTLVVLGLAVIVGAAGAAAHQAGVDWFTTTRVLALTLAVVGVGLVHAGLRRRRSGRHSTGLVPVALALGVAVVVSAAVANLDGLPPGGTGERTWKPLSENEIQSEYTLTMGRMTLDLRSVELTGDRTVDLHNGIGEVAVLLPPGMNVRAHCETRIGDESCPEGLSGGDDGTEGPVLTVNARSNVGHVEVTR